MSFLHPNVLFLIPLVLILFGFLLTQKESQATFFSDEMMKKLQVTSNNLSLKARNVLFLIISILLIVTLATPMIKDAKVEVSAKSADIMLALDISDSMLAEDVYPNRLNAAKQKALDLLKLAPNERIGIIAFAKNSYLVSPLSFDHNAVRFLLRQLDTSSITEKGTNLLSMLQVVDKSIQKKSQKYLLIFSDGGDKDDFHEEIDFAKKHKIVVFVLGMGTSKGAPIKRKDGRFIKQNGEIIVSKLNENMADLATSTGGVYIENVRSQKDIETMLVEIENHSKKRELKSEEVQRYKALFYYPLALALFLLLFATSSFSKHTKLNILTAFSLLSLLNLQEVNAGILDFADLSSAKSAYENKEYAHAAELYKQYAKESKSIESYYNQGNALYKQKNYKKAIQAYEKASFESKSDNAKKYANIGNSYVKQAKPQSLKKAVASYEKSLKLKDDKAVREDLEAVKKYLKKQEQKKKKQKKKQDKNSKDKKKKSDDKQKSKDSKDKKKSDKKKDSQGKQKSDKKSQEKKKKEKQKEKKEQQKKEKEKKQEKMKELEDKKKEKEKSKQSESQAKQKQMSSKKMSNEEEKKWLQKLNQQQNTYMYRLNKQNNEKEDSNEKPW